MSYNIRNIREISNDPLTKFTNQLAKKLSQFLNKNEIDKLENKEDIYSDGQDIDVVLRFNNLNSTKYFDFTTEYFPPTEPDNDKLKLWIKGSGLGNTVEDKSGFNHTIYMIGDPMLLDGAPFDYGIHTGGVKSICLRFNRTEYSDFLAIDDSTDIQISGISTGVSYFARIRPQSIALQAGNTVSIYSKPDDSTPNNGAKIQIDTTGHVEFHVKRSGVDYKWKTTNSVITVNNVYDIWCTYAVSGNTIHIYVNNVDQALTAGTTTIVADTDFDGRIMKRQHAEDAGYFYCDLYDFMMFKEKVVSAAEVGRHYTNKWTLANIPFGQVAVANYFATYYLTPSVTSFTSSSFTSGSFTG